METNEIQEKIDFEIKRMKRQNRKNIRKLKGEISLTFQKEFDKRFNIEFEKLRDNLNNKLFAQYEKLKTLELEIITKAKEEVRDILNNEMFTNEVKKFIIRSMSQEIKVALSDNRMREIVTEKIEDATKDKFQDVIKTVCDRVLTKMNSVFQKQAQITKDLVYSIESEVRHLSQKEGLSCSTDDLIKEFIECKSKKELLQIENLGEVENEM